MPLTENKDIGSWDISLNEGNERNVQWTLHTGALGTAKGQSTNGARTATCFSTTEWSPPQLEIVLGHSSTKGAWQDRMTVTSPPECSFNRDNRDTYIHTCVKPVNYHHLSGRAVLFSLCTYSTSHINAENRYIKKCIYFSKGMSMQPIQSKTTSKDATMSSFCNPK